ncbi:hypothetical protein SAMN04487944_1093 [Gracilibacillus ureilyticus]|uniref:Uncharacterized protein n=1 Tax=Gracilibacillus ureilyticus TaxID=531814 RepID=A0A1H9RJ68_9BACI|nr:hypothetical protein [Gracilibacillus ureilyticus]SER72667.1 hypothetical protein SAMN04487944_1093 [Gracilibacillus ureilyticus]
MFVLFSVLLFISLAFIYDALRRLNKNTEKQLELLEQLKLQNEQILSRDDKNR